MTATEAFHIFLGAALVSVGVLIAALAERIRNVRNTREVAPRERASRVQSPVVIPVADQTWRLDYRSSKEHAG